MQPSLNRTTKEKGNCIFEIMKIDSNDWHCRDSDDYVSSRPTEYGTQQWKLTREESSFPSFRPKLFLNIVESINVDADALTIFGFLIKTAADANCRLYVSIELSISSE